MKTVEGVDAGPCTTCVYLWKGFLCEFFETKMTPVKVLEGCEHWLNSFEDL